MEPTGNVVGALLERPHEKRTINSLKLVHLWKLDPVKISCCTVVIVSYCYIVRPDQINFTFVDFSVAVTYRKDVTIKYSSSLWPQVAKNCMAHLVHAGWWSDSEMEGLDVRPNHQ